MRPRLARWAPLLSLVTLAACRRVPATEGVDLGETRAATDAGARPAASTVTVRGCVTIDGAAAPDARVEAYTPGEGRWAVSLEPDGCFRVAQEVARLSSVWATAPGHGTVFAPVLPIAGSIELALALPEAGRVDAAEIRSDDDASRLAALAGWYWNTLRARPTAEHLRAVAERHDAERDPTARAVYGLIYVVLARTPGAPAEAIEAPRIKAAIAALSPTHIAWSVEMESLILASRGGDVSPDYLQRVLDEHPDLLVVGAAAFALASEAQGRGDTERVRAVVTRLRQRGADSPLGRFALEFDPDDQLAEGRPVPPFRLHALDGGAEIDSESLRGKVVVLHFWATWCRPCVDKLPALAALHARHAAAGLEVVSLSIDEDPAVIAAFRSAMPWTHAWEPPETAEALRARYQVAGSTKAIVIGRDGVVVAEHLEVSDPEFEARIVEALARR